MSYDVYLRRPECPTCHHRDRGPDLPGPTYNLTPIFDLALTGETLPNEGTSEFQVVVLGQETDRPRGLRVLNGRTGRDTLKQLNAAVFALCDAPEKVEAFRALEPANGWGTLKDAREVMKVLRAAAEEYPDHVWEVQ